MGCGSCFLVGFCSFASHLSVGVWWQFGFGFLTFDLLLFHLPVVTSQRLQSLVECLRFFNIFEKLNQVTIGPVQNTLLLND